MDDVRGMKEYCLQLLKNLIWAELHVNFFSSVNFRPGKDDDNNNDLKKNLI